MTQFHPDFLRQYQRILVVKPSSMGDVVHTLPAVEAIRRVAPDVEIDWLVNTEWKPILSGASFIDQRIEFPRKQFRGIGGLLRAKRWAAEVLPPKSYDLAIDFQALLRSAWLARHSARHVIGFAQARESASHFYHSTVSLPEGPLHAVDRYLTLAKALGADVDAPRFQLPQGTMPEGFLDSGEEPIVIHPFSRGRGKSLSVAEVRELCSLLAPRFVVLVGASLPDGSVDWPDNVVNLIGKTTLLELIYVLRNAAWVISVDSGPMHLAAGLSDRVLSLHTWTNPAMVGPYSKSAWIWREGRLVQVCELQANDFPEHRRLAREYEARERILDRAAIEKIAAFALDQIRVKTT